MMNDSLITLPLAKLKRAVSIREQIEALELELNHLLGDLTPGSTNGALPNQNGDLNTRLNVASGTQRLSPSGRAKISAVVKARWERYRVAKLKGRKTR